MIENRLQFEISNRALKDLQTLLRSHENEEEKETTQVHVLFKQAEIRGLESLIEEIQHELSCFEKNYSNRTEKNIVLSIDELPNALINARIENGLTYKSLAKILSIDEEKILEYEATAFANADIVTVKSFCKALNIQYNDELFSPPRKSITQVLRDLKKIGFSDELIDRYLTPDYLVEKDRDGVNYGEFTFVRYLKYLTRFFNISNSADFTESMYEEQINAINYKKPKNANPVKVSAESFFIIRLANVLFQYLPNNDVTITPKTAPQVREEIIKSNGEVNYVSVLNYIWNMGIPVIPVFGLKSFHAACIKLNQKYVIFLSAYTKYESRVLFNLLHELLHVFQQTNVDEYYDFMMENDNLGADITIFEKEANLFAADILLNLKAEKLVSEVVKIAGKNVKRLKNAVIKVSRDYKIEQSHFANYLAYRLGLQNINWWGCATNLQIINNDLWDITGYVFRERVQLEGLERSVRYLIEGMLYE